MKFSWKPLEREMMPFDINCFVIQWGEMKMQDDGRIGEWSSYPVYMPPFLIGVVEEIAL